MIINLNRCYSTLGQLSVTRNNFRLNESGDDRLLEAADKKDHLKAEEPRSDGYVVQCHPAQVVYHSKRPDGHQRGQQVDKAQVFADLGSIRLKGDNSIKPNKASPLYTYV